MAFFNPKRPTRYEADPARALEALEAAEQRFPGDTFVASCRSQLDERGYLTPPQVERLEFKVAEPVRWPGGRR